MPTRKQILFAPADFSKEELANAVKDGVVTYDELCSTNEAFPHSLRVKVKCLIECQEAVSKEERDKEIWANVPRYDITAIQEFIKENPNNVYLRTAEEILDKLIWEKLPKDVQAIQDFIIKYPKSAFIDDAKNQIDKLSIPKTTLQKILKRVNKFRNLKDGEDKISEKILKEIREFISGSFEQKQEFMHYFKEHLNFLNQAEVKTLYDEKIITESDLNNLIDEDFKEVFLYGEENEKLPSNTDVEPVEETSTEFYFWGGPGSGKTCLMAALLNSANSGDSPYVKSLIPKICSSGDYMSKLKTYFHGQDVITLMERTHSGNINAMEFALNDGEKEHPITFVDMPGEVLEDMYFDRNTTTHQVDRKKQLEDLDKLLMGNNKNHKIHLFIVEYGSENKINKKTGVPQSELLEYAAQYINELGLFKKETDLIMIIVTKADLAPTGTNFGEYLTTNFKGFKSNLKTICKKNHINAGNVDWRKFSIGEVVFQKYARFNREDALKILEIIIDRTWTEQGWLVKLLGK